MPDTLAAGPGTDARFEGIVGRDVVGDVLQVLALMTRRSAWRHMLIEVESSRPLHLHMCKTAAGADPDSRECCPRVTIGKRPEARYRKVPPYIQRSPPL